MLKLNRDREERKRAVQRKVITTFRRQYMYIHFRKWREAARKMREVEMPDTLRGTQIQLDEFKHKLAMFDVALSHVQRTKLDQGRLDSILSQNKSTNRDVYREMAALFDLSV